MSKYITNSLWLMFDKFFLLIGGLFAFILVSRYLGPTEFGILSYGVAISALCVTLSQWGANHTIFNQSIIKNKRAVLLVQSSSVLRFWIYICSWAFVTIVLAFIPEFRDHLLIISLVILTHVYLALDLYQYFYNGSLLSSINAKSNLWGKSASTIMRCLFVLLALKPIFFVLPYLINNLLLYTLRKKYFPVYSLNSKRKKLYAKSFFYSGNYFLLSGLFSLVYTKINEILIAHSSGFEESGILSVGVALGFAFTFIPISIGTTYLNKALSSEPENRAKLFSMVNLLMIISFFPVVIVLYFFGTYIVSLLLGVKYVELSEYLWLISLIGLISSLGVINNRIIGNYPYGSKYLFIKILFCSVVSLPIAYYFITNSGLKGAIFSLFISELLSLTLANYFFNKALIFKVHFGLFKVFSNNFVTFVRR